MPTPFDAGALVGVGSCGCHQSIAAPIASGNFTNIATNNVADGIYTLNDAPCAITDIIDVDHPDSVFDLGAVDSSGIKAPFPGLQMFLKDPLLTQLLTGGFTIVVEAIPDTNAPIEFDLANASYSDRSFCTARAGYIEVSSFNGGDFFSDTEVATAGEISRLAFTCTDAKMAMSLNGGSVHLVEDIGIAPDADRIYFSTNTSSVFRLRSFAFYEQVDDVDLPTLSAL